MYETYQECFNIIRQYFEIENVLHGSEYERNFWKKEVYEKLEEIEKILSNDFHLLKKKLGNEFIEKNKSDILVCIESKDKILEIIRDWK